MRFIDPASKNVWDVATSIVCMDGNKCIQDILVDSLINDRMVAAYKVELETALVYDAIKMFAEAVKVAPKIIPPLMTCYDTESWTQGQTVVNLMKGVN